MSLSPARQPLPSSDTNHHGQASGRSHGQTLRVERRDCVAAVDLVLEQASALAKAEAGNLVEL